MLKLYVSVNEHQESVKVSEYAFQFHIFEKQ